MVQLEHLIALIFGTFFVWTALLHWSPKAPPGWTRPALVLAIAAVLDRVQPRLLDIIAATGAVGLMYYVWELG